MRGFSIVAFCSYSVNKYHREYIKTHHFDIRHTFFFGGGAHSPRTRLHPLDAFGARPPVHILDGLDTRPCKILDLCLN